ncbi:MAG TPA: iron ABC transporter permease [Candidatus Methylomirabilis sp.]|nr:iron ABC transporter permease [Candidatus Methylomirabilis sp.]
MDAIPRDTWLARSAHDLRRLRGEPVLCAAILAIFGLLLLFILYPLARVLTVSLFPDGAFTLRLFREHLGSWFIRQALLNSILMGILTALGGTAIGFLFAFTLTRTGVPGKAFFTLAAILPIISPPFVSALSIILLFGNNGLVTRGLLGLQEFAIYGMRGLLLAQVFTFFPVAYLTLRGILESLGGTLEDAAMNLGASRWKAFKRVTLPLCLPGIASALLVLFIESIADFGNPLILGGSGFPVLSVQVYLQVTGMYDLPGGAALAVVLLVPSVTTFLLQRYWVARKRYVTVTGKPTRAVIRAVSPAMQRVLFGACLAVTLFVLLFYATILVGAFSRAWGADHRFTLRNFGYVFGVGAQAITDTVTIAVTASPLSGLLGMAIAFLVIRRRFPGRRAMEFISILNFAVPGTVIGIGYILAFNQRPLLLTGTALILVANFLFRYIPVGIQAGVAGLRQIDPAIEEAATNLGASSPVTFRRITLPMLVPAFFSGLVFSFVRAMTAISAAIFLVSADWNLMTVQILSQTEAGRLGAAAAFSVLLILIILVAIGLIRLILGRLFDYRYEAAFG